MDGRALDTGIYSYFNTGTNQFKTAMNSRFYNTVAPVNATKPHAVFAVIAAANKNTFTEYVDDILLKISIFDETQSKLTINDHVKKCTALFDKAIIQVTGCEQITMRRENIVTPFQDEFKVWNAHIYYTFLFEY